MTDDVEAKPTFKGIATALASAQGAMGKALKSSDNPHFKSKYADLASVIDACMPALTAHGIAVIQPTGENEFGRYVRTILIHGDSGETLECVVPLIIGKNDMQGYGSAVTYARRYGLLSMSGIAPADDDGNAAAKAAPTSVSAEQFIELRDLLETSGADLSKFLKAFQASSLEQFPSDKFGHARVQLGRKIAENQTATTEAAQ
jgi:hypothetical protein